MSARLAAVLSTADLPLAELCAARLDGELIALAGCFSPIDLPESPRHRALALGSGLPCRLIAERASAAWVWGARDTAPRRHAFCVSTGARTHLATSAWARVREVVIDPDELSELAGLQLTTPLRTALDIVRWQEHFDQLDATTLRRLAELGDFGLTACLERVMARRNLPYRSRALRRLRSSLSDRA